MTKVLFVLSSVREGRIADRVLEQVQEELKKYNDIEPTVVDFRATPLPLIDSPYVPAMDEFDPSNENVKKWTSQVEEADAVVVLVAEYNHSYTPVIKNAIDWVYKPWIDKPVAFISYGWAGGTRATKHLRDVFASNISAKALDAEANLFFTKDIELDGSPIGDSAKESINKVLEAVGAV